MSAEDFLNCLYMSYEHILVALNRCYSFHYFVKTTLESKLRIEAANDRVHEVPSEDNHHDPREYGQSMPEPHDGEDVKASKPTTAGGEHTVYMFID